MDQSNVAPLSGFRLWAAAVVIAGANFMVVLDMTIANVSIPNIAGSLGATTTQGTWVITSYAVAEAIVLPLTGWLSARFGLVRTFISATGLFVLFSIFCGVATSLSMLVAARVLQGLAGGPLMPLSQTLLLRIFPKEQAGMAITLWSMTTLLAPITGPVLGGWICENWSWPWIFFINIPLGVVVVYFSENDWFASTTITLLAIVSLIGFAAFLIWELNIDHPIVDLKVFRHKAFWVAVLVMSIGYASFMTLNVLTPLWLQLNMDYTASQAGRTIGWTGLFSLCMAPFVARLAVKVDRRKLISGGLIWLSGVTALRCLGSTELTYWDIAFPLMIMGLGMPFFFISVSGMALASVNTDETASAAGLLNFSRTLLAAFAISVMTTNWESYTVTVYADLVGSIDANGDLFKALSQSGVESNKIYSMMDRLLSAQSLMIATNTIMAIVALAFLLGAIAIWVAPRPRAWSAETTGSVQA